MTAETALTPVVAKAGSGVVAGGVTGYAAKKLVKLLLIIVGLQLALLKYLESKGLINNVDFAGIVAGVQDFLASADLLRLAANAGMVGGTFAGGFALGFYKG